MKCDWPGGCDSDEGEYAMWEITIDSGDGYFCHGHLYLALKAWYEKHPEQLPKRVAR